MVLLYPDELARPQPLLLSAKLSENRGVEVEVVVALLAGTVVDPLPVTFELLPLLFTKKKIPPPTTNARRRMIPITNPLFGLFLEGARLYPLVICDGCPYTPGIPVEGEEAAGEELCLADP
jgi:hypothetical protein